MPSDALENFLQQYFATVPLEILQAILNHEDSIDFNTIKFLRNNLLRKRRATIDIRCVNFGCLYF